VKEKRMAIEEIVLGTKSAELLFIERLFYSEEIVGLELDYEVNNNLH
jgi:hypothetical protein